MRQVRADGEGDEVATLLLAQAEHQEIGSKGLGLLPVLDQPVDRGLVVGAELGRAA